MLLALLWLAASDPQILAECKDAKGVKIVVVEDGSMKSPALAKGSAGGEPIIQYNPKALTWIHQRTRQFIFAHECAHHALAHLFSPITYAKEQQADCWAIQLLHHKGLI